MAKFLVDTTQKLFIAKAGVTSFDVQIDLYSDAKEHWLADPTAIGFDFPVRTVAGDVRSDGSVVEPFYFLRNGWKIRPHEADHTLQILGNLELDQGETGELIVPTVGDFTVLVTANTTNRGTLLSSASEDIYTAKALLFHDASGKDFYIVSWFKNGVVVTSGITSPKIRVVKVSDGSDLIPLTAMTEVASLERYKYEASGSQQIVPGRGYIIMTEAVIDGNLRSWDQPIGVQKV